MKRRTHRILFILGVASTLASIALAVNELYLLATVMVLTGNALAATATIQKARYVLAEIIKEEVNNETQI